MGDGFMTHSDSFRLKTLFYMDMLDTCPCCGYVWDAEEHDICDICRWQDDYVQRRFPDSLGANGKFSLRIGQKLYAEIGVSKDHGPDYRGGKPKPDDVRNPRWRPLTELEDHMYPASHEHRIRCDLYARLDGACLCCGFRYSPNDHGLCAICGWTRVLSYRPFPCAYDDDYGELFLDLWQAQENYRAFGACHQRIIETNQHRPPDPTDSIHPDWRPLIELRDQLTEVDDPEAALHSGRYGRQSNESP
jgi:hypothetical protein